MIRFEIPQNIDFSDSALALKQMWSYIQSMQEQMTVILRNLGMENFNAAGLSDITAPIKRQIADVEGNVTEVKVTAEGASVTASDALGKAATAQITADGASVTASAADGKATSAQITANGASMTASDAYGKAQQVKLTVDGLSIANQSGSYTIIDGDKLESYDAYSGAQVVIEDGAVTNTASGRSARLTSGSLNFGSGWSYEPGTIYYDGTGLYIACDSALKLQAYSNMSLDAIGTIYIGASGGGNDVHIGSFGSSNVINLYGDVRVNGVPIGGGE